MNMVLILVGLLGTITCTVFLILFKKQKKSMKIPFILLIISILLLFAGITTTLITSAIDALKPITANEDNQPSTINNTTLPPATTQATPSASTSNTTQPAAVTAVTPPVTANPGTQPAAITSATKTESSDDD